MEVLKCKNPECGIIVDALHMDDEGYCIICHNKMLDMLIIEESEETKYLSDESLNIMCKYPTRVGRMQRSNNKRRDRYGI